MSWPVGYRTATAVAIRGAERVGASLVLPPGLGEFIAAFLAAYTIYEIYQALTSSNDWVSPCTRNAGESYGDFAIRCFRRSEFVEDNRPPLSVVAKGHEAWSGWTFNWCGGYHGYCSKGSLPVVASGAHPLATCCSSVGFGAAGPGGTTGTYDAVGFWAQYTSLWWQYQGIANKTPAEDITYAQTATVGAAAPPVRGGKGWDLPIGWPVTPWRPPRTAPGEWQSTATQVGSDAAARALDRARASRAKPKEITKVDTVSGAVSQTYADTWGFPPDEMTQEQKKAFVKARLSVNFLAEASTELNDFVTAFWKGLPKKCRNNQARTISEKAFNVFSCWSSLTPFDFRNILVEVIANQLQDFFYGSVGRAFIKQWQKFRATSEYFVNPESPRGALTGGRYYPTYQDKGAVFYKTTGKKNRSFKSPKSDDVWHEVAIFIVYNFLSK